MILQHDPFQIHPFSMKTYSKFPTSMINKDIKLAILFGLPTDFVYFHQLRILPTNINFVAKIYFFLVKTLKNTK